MNSLAKRLALVLVLLAFGTCVNADEDAAPTKAAAVQTIKVNGSDLTGLNAGAITSMLNQAKKQGAGTVVVDMGSVTYMAPAGMDALAAGTEIFGQGHFGVANLSGQPAELAQGEGAGRFETFATVEEAAAALK